MFKGYLFLLCQNLQEKKRKKLGPSSTGSNFFEHSLAGHVLLKYHSFLFIYLFFLTSLTIFTELLNKNNGQYAFPTQLFYLTSPTSMIMKLNQIYTQF